MVRKAGLHGSPAAKNNGAASSTPMSFSPPASPSLYSRTFRPPNASGSSSSPASSSTSSPTSSSSRFSAAPNGRQELAAAQSANFTKPNQLQIEISSPAGAVGLSANVRKAE